MAAPRHRPRRLRRGQGRHRALADPHRRAGARPRLRDVCRRARCRRPNSRSRPTSISCARSRWSRRSRRASPNSSPPRSIAAASPACWPTTISSTRPWSPISAAGSTRRRRTRTSRFEYVKRNARTVEAAARRDRGAQVQDRRLVGAARRAASRLCLRRRSRPAPSGRADAMTIDRNSRPRLPRGRETPARRRARALDAARAGAHLRDRRDRRGGARALRRRDATLRQSSPSSRSAILRRQPSSRRTSSPCSATSRRKGCWKHDCS